MSSGPGENELSQGDYRELRGQQLVAANLFARIMRRGSELVMTCEAWKRTIGCLSFHVAKVMVGMKIAPRDAEFSNPRIIAKGDTYAFYFEIRRKGGPLRKLDAVHHRFADV